MLDQTLNSRYHITAQLGEGAMGEVYRATDTHTGQTVAIKVITQRLALDDDMLARFRREGEALRQLRHANIVAFVDMFAVGKQQAIVMEYVSGGSLHGLIQRGPLPLDRAVRITLELSDALSRAHLLSIIHRDIKPENVLLAEDGTPKLTDFGVARLVSETQRLTSTGTQVGTPYYMSPEAWEGKKLDEQADIWSLGIVLFEMVTGQVPFTGDTFVAVMNKVLTTPPPDLKTLRPEVPPALVKIIQRMLARDKTKRYGSMREVALDLERVMKGTEAETLGRSTRIEKKFPWRTLVIGGAGLLAGLCLLAIAGLGVQALASRFLAPPALTPTLTAVVATAPAASQTASQTPVVITQAPTATQVVPPAVASPTAAVATPTPKPKGEITVWMWSGSEDAIRNSGVEDAFYKEYPDIKINWVTYGSTDINQNLPPALSAGAGAPDVSLVEDSNLAPLVYQGGLADLSGRVGPYQGLMNKYKWNTAAKAGKYYAMPWDSGPVVLYYRRDVFKAAGLPDKPGDVGQLIPTWDDYLKVCQTIKDKTGVPCFMLNKAGNDARLYETVLWQQGLGYYNAGGQVTIDSPENVATLEKLGEFWKAGLLADEAPYSDPWYARFRSLALKNAVATHVEAAWMSGVFKTTGAPEAAGKWGVAEMPAMKAGQARASNDGGSSFVIPDQSRNKDAAWAFIEFITARASSQNKLFAFADIFPSFEPAYADGLYAEPDSYFAGESVREYYLNASKVVPTGYVYGPYYSAMHDKVQTAIQKYATGAASAADALKAAADAVRADTGMK